MNDGPITFFVPGHPRGKGRPRFTRNGQPYTDRQTREYEQSIALAYRTARGRLFPQDAFLSVRVNVAMPIPKSASKAKQAAMLEGRIACPAKPDLDNVVKAVLDGLNGVAYRDDARVANIHASKFYSGIPGIYVTVQEVKGNGMA